MTKVRSLVDRRLLSQLRASDGLVALEQVYRRHAWALISLVTHCTGDSALARQVVEDVFVHLWEQPKSFDRPQASLRSCLAEDAYWRCKAVGAFGPATAERHGDGLFGPWRVLSREERLVIALCLGEMSSHRISSVLGVTQDGVNATISKGLRRLARA